MASAINVNLFTKLMEQCKNIIWKLLCINPNTELTGCGCSRYEAAKVAVRTEFVQLRVVLPLK